MINDDNPFIPSLRDTAEAEQFLFDLPGVQHVNIFGINALGLVHGHQGELMAILRRSGSIDILLLDPETEAFRDQCDREENHNGRIANRLLKEMEATEAILRDILNALIPDQDGGLSELSRRFRLRLHDHRPKMAMMSVESEDARFVLYRDLSPLPKVTGGATQSFLVEDDGTAASVYRERLHQFTQVWNVAWPVPLKDLKSELVVVSPGTEDIPHIYAQAVKLHKQRRLDEASALYRKVLSLEEPVAPSSQQMAAVRRYLPRLYTTRSEPFGLKDLVVVIHPEPERRLIGYHLVWEDDIDYLDDNDPSDHEVVWVRYSVDGAVEAAWSYWHDRILTTERAVTDANVNGGRVRVNVQWGKHGSLLDGWHEKVGVDAAVPGYSEFETMEFTRLTEGRNPSEGAYPGRWPDRFEGSRDDFLDFAVEIDLYSKLREHNMIIVSRYANAVISQWFLPYNIRPKDDWLREITEPG
jgi:hypothetical protein